MIINCGNRRLKSDRFGWKIEAKHIPEDGKNKGQVTWVEDRPAYPATLSQALEMIYEREIKDQGDMALTDVPSACMAAARAVREYARLAREAA